MKWRYNSERYTRKEYNARYRKVAAIRSYLASGSIPTAYKLRLSFRQRIISTIPQSAFIGLFRCYIALDERIYMRGHYSHRQLTAGVAAASRHMRQVCLVTELVARALNAPSAIDDIVTRINITSDHRTISINNYSRQICISDPDKGS